MFDFQPEPTRAEEHFYEECVAAGLPADPSLYPEVVVSMIRAVSVVLAAGFGQFIRDDPTLVPYYTAALRAIAKTHAESAAERLAEETAEAFGDLPVTVRGDD